MSLKILLLYVAILTLGYLFGTALAEYARQSVHGTEYEEFDK